ncbi:hypothetical protein [Paenibacillus puerhi]|uniref:hypothetical protein n=1 Tax=Paenibacillus puerhi TaxID=2692622 RepID=UPI00135B3374|nr:hypothetical protein [Paenibacillus puerhi]
MSGFTYQRAYRFRKAASALLAVTVVAAGWKTYEAAQTARAFNQAQALHAAGQLPEAEALYTKAGSISGFDYRRAEIAAALEQLRPVVHLMRTVTGLSEAVAAASASGDVAALTKVHTELQAAQESIGRSGADHKERFDAAMKEAGVEAKLGEAFSAARKAAETKIAGAKAAEDTSAAAAELILIPSVYYGGDAAKLKAVNARLQTRDTARLDALARTKPYLEVWKLGDELRQFYERQGWEAAWVAPKLEKLALGTLSIVEKQDLEKFLEAARQLTGYKSWAGPGSKIEAYIDSIITARLKKADALSASGKHEEAVALYRTIGGYRDTSKELQAAEQRQLAGDPQRLLTAAGASGKLTLVTALKPASGLPQAAALDATGTKLLLAQLSADGSPSLHEAVLDPAVKKGSIRYSDLTGPGGDKLLLVEAASTRRSARYMLLLVGEQGAPQLVLDVEADALSSSGKGELTATRPWIASDRQVPDDQPMRGHYKFDRERYVLIRTEGVPAEPDEELSEQSGPGAAARPGGTAAPQTGGSTPGGGTRPKAQQPGAEKPGTEKPAAPASSSTADQPAAERRIPQAP